jgi:DNA-binding IclR family transcriptional regulator
LRAAIESAAANLGTNGYVLTSFYPDVNAVAAPAFDRLGKPRYVVSCGGPNLKAKFMRDEVGPRISRLARKITVALAARSI